MKLNIYANFAYRADEIGLDETAALAKLMGVSLKLINTFIRFYTGK